MNVFKQYLLQMIRLFVTKKGDAIGFRQQLSTTLFEAFELQVAVKYPLHT